MSKTHLKYQLVVDGGRKIAIREWKNTNKFIDYSQTIYDIYENLEDYNPTQKESVNSL